MRSLMVDHMVGFVIHHKRLSKITNNMSYYDMVEGKNTNSNLLRYIVNAVVVGNGVKLEPSYIFRWTKTQKAPPRWAQQNPQKPCKCFFTKGGSQSGTSMLAWLKEILLPWCASNGRRPDEWV